MVVGRGVIEILHTMEKKTYKPRIGITHGDINGINYELLLRIFANNDICEFYTPIIYGSPKVASYWRKVLKVDTTPWNRINHPDEALEGEVNILSCIADEVKVEIGIPSEIAGLAAYQALDLATQHALEKKIDALVTAPINKSVMPQELFPYKGHTDFLGTRCGLEEGKKPLMILMKGGVKVALATTHLPIREVPESINQALIISKLKDIEQALQRDFNIAKPRIAVLGLNPHCGDNGLIGKEEEEIIAPAIRVALEEEGLLAFGPFAADGFWGSSELTKYDAILSLYHDQGLAPFKALFMDEGINFTAGLPIVRTSPDHGTGFDIAGQGKASEESLRQAIYVAIDTIRNRHRFDYARRNPLRKLYSERGHDNENIEAITIQQD